MLNVLKDKIAHSIVDWKLKKKEYGYQTFTEFFKKSFSFLVLMPHDETDFAHSVQVLNFLEEKRKHASILTYDFRVSLLPLRLRPKVIEHTQAHVSMVKLPSSKITDKLASMNFNVILDLNRKENLFYSYISSTLDVPIKVGFSKPNSDKYYNFQILDNEKEAELSYKNFLHCLEIFQGDK